MSNNTLHWKCRNPTVPGFYYWQGNELKGKEVAMIKVEGYKDKKRKPIAIELRSSDVQHAPDTSAVDLWPGLWAGPLPEPHWY